MMEKPHLAATVILLRPAQPNGFEVLLTRRAEGMAFLAGVYCFPGGALRKADFSEAMLCRSAGIAPNQAQKTLGAEFSPRQAVGLWVAAVRELFEETGILLAVNHTGAPIEINAKMTSTLRDAHRRLLATPLDFLPLLESEGLFWDLSALAHFAHWQTPAHEPVRFNTHFFLARAPAGQFSMPTSAEVAHSLWLTPDAALRLFSKNQLPMIFPTFASLRMLADHDSLEGVLKKYRIGREGS
jgi:8-oxo-dGTP pyrophosphatase MutT (NUDIX family)